MPSERFAFTPQELLAIDCALGIAAHVYEDDAKVAEQDGQPRVAAQFRQQAEAARALAEKIAEA